MSEIEQYKEWLSSAPSEEGILVTIEVDHPTWVDPVRLANWDVNINCAVDTGSQVIAYEFLASRFWLEPAKTGDTTSQSTSIAISSIDGLIYAALKAMTPADREAGPITLIPRLYWISNQNEQLVNPAPVWEIHNVTVSLDVVKGTLQAPQMRTQRIGRYYTALEFPILRLSA